MLASYIELRRSSNSCNCPWRVPSSSVRTLQAADGVRSTLSFSAAIAGNLSVAMSSANLSEQDVLAYWDARTAEALNSGPAVDQQLRDDPSVPELVANCYGAFHWLLGQLGQVNRGTLGLLVGRDTRRSGWRWINQLTMKPDRTQTFFS